MQEKNKEREIKVDGFYLIHLTEEKDSYNFQILNKVQIEKDG